MDQNLAAAKALTLIHKNKKIQMCIPQDRVTPCSSLSGRKCVISTPPMPATKSTSATSSLEEEGDESFVDLSSAPMEPMDTTESLVTAATNKTQSSTSEASGAALVQMQSSRSGDNSPGRSPVPCQPMRNPSDYEPSSPSEASGSLDSSTNVLSTRSSDVVVASHMPSASTISSSEIVGMDLSPSVPSGPSFSLPAGKDDLSSVLPVAGLSDIAIPGEFRRRGRSWKFLNFLSTAPPILTEDLVYKLIEQGQSAFDPDFRDLTNQIWLVFSSPDSLNQSFLLPQDEVSVTGQETGIKVDLVSLRRTYSAMFGLESDRVKNTMINAMEMYRGYLQRQKAFKTKESLSHFVILLENPLLPSPEFLKCFPKLLKAMVTLPISQKERLIRWYSHYPTDDLLNLIRSLQQLITLQLLFSEEEHPHHYLLQSDPSIAAASGAMGFFFFANLLKARREDGMKTMTNTLNSFVAKPKPEFMQTSDTDYEQLILRLQVHPSLIRHFPIPLSEFINEELNRRVDMSVDYQREYGSSIGDKTFSFLEHPYMLNVTNKVEKLYRDNLVSMFSERHRAVIHSVLTGVADIPYLVLRVSREKIIEDTLVQVSLINIHPASLVTDK